MRFACAFKKEKKELHNRFDPSAIYYILYSLLDSLVASGARFIFFTRGCKLYTKLWPKERRARLRSINKSSRRFEHNYLKSLNFILYTRDHTKLYLCAPAVRFLMYIYTLIMYMQIQNSVYISRKKFKKFFTLARQIFPEAPFARTAYLM